MPGDSVSLTVKCDTTHRGNYAAGDGYPSTDDALRRDQDVSGDTYNASKGTITIGDNHQGAKGVQPDSSYGAFIDPSNYVVVCQVYGYDTTQGKTLLNKTGDNQADRFFYDKTLMY